MATLTRNKEALLRLVLHTSSQAFLLLDEQGMIQGASRPLCDLLNIDWPELVGNPFSIIAPPELNPVQLSPPPAGKIELLIVDQAGEKIQSDWNVIPWSEKPESGEEKMYTAYLQNWQGKPGSGRDSYLDQTVREHLYESLPIGMLVTDRNGQIVLYNSTQEKITGIERTAVLGRVLFKDYASQASKEILETFEKALHKGVEGSEHEFDYTDRFGVRRRFKSHISSLIGPDGRIHGVVQTLEDVSRPRLLEQEINRTMDFLKRLLDTTPNALFTADMDGKITFYNRSAEQMLGLESIADGDILIGDLYLGGKREAEQLMHYLDECNGIVENYETYFTDISGKEVPVSLTLSLLFGEEGQPAGTICIARNLSWEKKLESDIRRNEHYLATFIQNSPDAVITLDERGLVNTWNQGALKMFGYSSEEMAGQPLDRLMPANSPSPDMWKAGRVEFASDGSIKHYVTDLLNRHGERLVLEATSTVLAEQGDNASNISGKLIIFRDITLRARLEQILQENIDDLSTVNEIMEALLSSKDLNEILGSILIGVTAGQGLGFNRAFLLLVDHKKSALVGRLAIGPSNPEEAGVIWSDVHKKYRSLHEIFEGYKSSGLDHDNIHVNQIVNNIHISLKDTGNPLVRSLKDKKSLNIINGIAMGTFPQDLASLLGTDTLAIVPIVFEHRSVGLLLADNLINHRPIEEEAVRKLHVFANLASHTIERSRLYISLEEKIEELNEAYRDLKESRDKLVQAEKLSALGHLATQVAHEIRNPLVSIGGFARSLYKDLKPKDPKREKARIILEAVDRLERYLKDTLTFMRSNQPVFHPVHPGELVQETFKMLDLELEASNIEIENRIMDNSPMIEVDPDQIRQVLLNIFRNALEAMPKGGKLTVSSSLSADYYTISIADTGIGIEKKNLEKLFTAFFTTKSSGSGLGLAISSRIIKSHGGTIGLSSKKGEGTVFHVTLPVKQAVNREVNHEETADRR